MNASVKDTEIKKFLIKTWIPVDTSFSCRDINPGVRGVCDNAALSADIIDPFMWLISQRYYDCYTNGIEELIWGLLIKLN